MVLRFHNGGNNNDVKTRITLIEIDVNIKSYRVSFNFIYDLTLLNVMKKNGFLEYFIYTFNLNSESFFIYSSLKILA